jgi:hypothetical protein
MEFKVNTIFLALALVFSLSGLPYADRRVIDNAYLIPTLKGQHFGITGCVHNITDSWEEYGVTWNNLPSWQISDLDCQEIYDFRPPFKVLFNLGASVVQEWIDDPSTNHGLLCLNDCQISHDEWYAFYSRESPYSGPELEVWWRWEGDPTQWYDIFNSVKDSYVEQAYPDKNNGGLEDLYAGYHEDYGMRIALMKFELWPTSVEEPYLPDGNVLADYTLKQNYPNPFNSETFIQFEIPCANHVCLRIYNVYGQFIRELSNNHMFAGSYNISWNGRDDEGKEVASGLYFYRLSSGNISQTRRMLLLK